MAENAQGGSAATYTQEQVDAMIAEREAGLKQNRDELLKETKAAKERLKAYEGVDPEEHKRLKAEKEEGERRKATAEGDFKSLEKQLIERHQSELTARETKIQKMQKAIDKRLVQANMASAIAKFEGDVDLLMPYAERFARVKETDDDFEAFIADERGNPLVADGKATPMSFEAFVEQVLMQKFPRAFKGTGSSGSGAAKSNGGAGGAKVIAAGDNSAFLQNLEAIAKGTVTVR